MKLTKTELTRLLEEVMAEAQSKADEEKLKKIAKQLKGSAIDARGASRGH